MMVILGGDDDEEGEEGGEDGEAVENTPTCGDYIVHFLTFAWKVIFAFIPPTGIAKHFTLYHERMKTIGK